MALINCPECSKEISNKSKQCVHCGCPINNEVECLVNGISYDLSFVLMDNLERIDAVLKLSQLTDCYLDDCINAVDKIRKTGVIPKSLTLTTLEEHRKPHCPKCNSTNIQAVTRKWSLLTGFMTNKVDRVCVNCKHKF